MRRCVHTGRALTAPRATRRPRAGFRERLLGDPSFPVKVAIECGIGIVTKVRAGRAGCPPKESNSLFSPARATLQPSCTQAARAGTHCPVT